MARSTSSTSATSLQKHLADGLAALSLAVQSGQRKRAAAKGLSATQAAILARLNSRPAETLRVSSLARELDVSQPTISDSIVALLDKRLIRKLADPDDQRAVRIAMTDAARRQLHDQPALDGKVMDAITGLGEPAQEQLLVLLTALVRSMQETGAIVPQRQCVTCKFFRPYAHSDAQHPHHCSFVNAAFGNAELRFQCAEHEAAGDEVQSANWTSFSTTADILRANANKT